MEGKQCKKKIICLIITTFITSMFFVGCSKQERYVATVNKEKISEVQFKYFLTTAKDDLYVVEKTDNLDTKKIKEKALQLAQKHKIWLSEAKQNNITATKSEVDDSLKLEMEVMGEGSPNEIMTEKEKNDKRSDFEKGKERWESYHDISFDEYKTLIVDTYLESKYKIIKNDAVYNSIEVKK